MLYYKDMKKLNKNLIINVVFIGFLITLAAFAGRASAEIVDSDRATDGRMRNVYYSFDAEIRNPRPAIYSLNPSPIKAGSGAVTVTIVGDNFVEGAVAKFNNFDRTTSFGSSTKLSMELLANDTSRTGDYVVTVYNPGPGGGLSNGYILSVTPPAPTATTKISSSGKSSAGTSSGAKSTTVKKTETETATEEEVYEEDGSYSDLTAGAIMGSGGFFPGSLVGWLILAILILLLVIIIRRMLGAEKHY